MPRKDYRTLIAAEAVVMEPRSTAEQVKAAIASVDALGDREQSVAIRQTLTHEAHHRADAPGNDAEGSDEASEGSGH
jgi:hypothetical protein